MSHQPFVAPRCLRICEAELSAARYELKPALEAAEATCHHKCHNSDTAAHAVCASRVQNDMGSMLVGVDLLPPA